MGVLAVVEMPFRTGLAKDKAVNTFAVGGLQDDDTDAAHTTLTTALINFYNVIMQGGINKALGTLLSPCIDRSTNACSVKLYDITGTSLKNDPALATAKSPNGYPHPHGSPFKVTRWTLAAYDSPTPYPEEVAYCATLEAFNRGSRPVETADGMDADFKPDRPRQRYTGRVYLGPFNMSVVPTVDGAGMARPAANFMAGVRNVVSKLCTDVNAIVTPNTYIGVWSRADGAIRAVDNVSTDDCFDTIRRRGASPTARTRASVGTINTAVELAS